jgi:hypothetical protein
MKNCPTMLSMKLRLMSMLKEQNLLQYNAQNIRDITLFNVVMTLPEINFFISSNSDLVAQLLVEEPSRM